MRSVWSRVGPGTLMVVVPSAASAANVRQPRTWALATDRVWSVASNGGLPTTTTGAWPPVVVTSAPTARSGAATRSMGRLESNSSPVRVATAGRPASAPVSSRMAVPALPQSSISPP